MNTISLITRQTHSLKTSTEPIERLYQYTKNIKPTSSTMILSNSHSIHSCRLITNSFQISQSYFSTPITCSPLPRLCCAPFSRNVVCASLGTSFHHKIHMTCHWLWPPTYREETQQTLHKTCLATKNGMESTKILVAFDKN